MRVFFFFFKPSLLKLKRAVPEFHRSHGSKRWVCGAVLWRAGGCITTKITRSRPGELSFGYVDYGQIFRSARFVFFKSVISHNLSAICKTYFFIFSFLILLLFQRRNRSVDIGNVTSMDSSLLYAFLKITSENLIIWKKKTVEHCSSGAKCGRGWGKSRADYGSCFNSRPLVANLWSYI